MIYDYENHDILKFSFCFPNNTMNAETNKLDWTLVDIRIERFQDFLNSMYLILKSRSFNYSMPKEGSSRVISERNSM